MDCSPPGSSVHGIFQAWILVAVSFSRGSSWPRDWSRVSRIVGRCFTIWATREVLICFNHAAAAAKSLQSWRFHNSVRPQRWQPTRHHHPWDSPGKNMGLGCHFLLQCIKVKSESEVAQSLPTVSNLTDCSLPGFSIYGIFQARIMEWVAMAFPMRVMVYDTNI